MVPTKAYPQGSGFLTQGRGGKDFETAAALSQLREDVKELSRALAETLSRSVASHCPPVAAPALAAAAPLATVAAPRQVISRQTQAGVAAFADVLQKVLDLVVEQSGVVLLDVAVCNLCGLCRWRSTCTTCSGVLSTSAVSAVSASVLQRYQL